MYKSVAVICMLLAFVGCSREQAAQESKAAAKSYQVSYRDNVIKNYQAKVADAPSCLQFKQKFQEVGMRHESATSALFHRDMIDVWTTVKSSGCAI